MFNENKVVTIYAAYAAKGNLQLAIDPRRLNGKIIASQERACVPAGSKTDNGFTLQPTVSLPNWWTIEGKDWFGFIPVDFVATSDESAISRKMNWGESRESLLSELTLSGSWEPIFNPLLDSMIILPYKPNGFMLEAYQGGGAYFDEGGLGLPAGSPVLRYIKKANGNIIPYNPETRHADHFGLGIFG